MGGRKFLGSRILARAYARHFAVQEPGWVDDSVCTQLLANARETVSAGVDGGLFWPGVLDVDRTLLAPRTSRLAEGERPASGLADDQGRHSLFFGD